MKAIFLLSVLTGFLQSSSSCSKPMNNQKLVQPIDTFKTYLALGDSYTNGQSILASQSYPAQTDSILNSWNLSFAAPDIIATTGWTTADLLNAIANKPIPTPAYDIVTLLIGVNNQYQGRSQLEYRNQFTSLLQKSIAYAGNRPSHVVVISIPDYSVSPYGQSTGDAGYIAIQIDSFNLINKQVADSFNVNYLNVTGISRQALNNPSLFANDGLHFSGKEYALWAAMLASIIYNIFK